MKMTLDRYDAIITAIETYIEDQTEEGQLFEAIGSIELASECRTQARLATSGMAVLMARFTEQASQLARRREEDMRGGENHGNEGGTDAGVD